MWEHDYHLAGRRIAEQNSSLLASTEVLQQSAAAQSMLEAPEASLHDLNASRQLQNYIPPPPKKRNRILSPALVRWEA
jgi:hypothetical protein